MEVAYLLNAGTVWINSIPIERGVQVRKQSGNFQTTGFRVNKNEVNLITKDDIYLFLNVFTRV